MNASTFREQTILSILLRDNTFALLLDPPHKAIVWALIAGKIVISLRSLWKGAKPWLPRRALCFLLLFMMEQMAKFAALQILELLKLSKFFLNAFEPMVFFVFQPFGCGWQVLVLWCLLHEYLVQTQLATNLVVRTAKSTRLRELRLRCGLPWHIFDRLAFFGDLLLNMAPIQGDLIIALLL